MPILSEASAVLPSTCKAALPSERHGQIPSGLTYNLPRSLHVISDLHLRSSAQHAGGMNTELPPAKPQLTTAHALESAGSQSRFPAGGI